MAEPSTASIEHFDRVWRVDVGDIGIDGTGFAVPRIRIAFDVSRGLERDANDCTLDVYNLSPPSRAKLEADTDEIVTARIQAGWRSTGAETIFFGALRNIHVHREGPDLVTTLEAGDGDRKSAGRVSKTWTKGTPIDRVLQGLMNAAGLKGDLSKLKKALRFNGKPTLERSFTAHGSTLEVLHHFCWGCGLEYSVQNQEFQFLELGQPLEGLGPKIERIIGSVETNYGSEKKKLKRRERNITFKTFLLPFLSPGAPFRLHDRDYRCERIRHTGDSRGGDWISEIEGKPLA